MLHSATLAPSFQRRFAHFHAGGIADAETFDRVCDQKVGQSLLLDRYRKGWTEANPDRIQDATAPGYRFCDPFVGCFSRRSLHKYFDLLQDRLSRAGAISRPDIGFFLRGPMDHPPHSSELRFWREALEVGLTGVTQIKVGEQGVIAESVVYDLNLASGMLYRTLQ